MTIKKGLFAYRLALGLFLAPALAGCAAILIGGGVAGGLTISKDTVELNADRPYNTVWSATLKEIKKMNGVLIIEDKKAGKIEANIKESKVEITLNQITPSTVQVHIKARKNLFPNIELANTLSTKIAARL